MTTVDLLSIIGTDTKLERTAGTRGGEYSGPCSFCGGTDRFKVHPNWGGGEWWCRGCSPDERWHSAADYLIKRDGISFREAQEKLGLAPNKPVQPEDPQTYPDRHGATWADFAKWDAKLDSYTDFKDGATYDAIFFNDRTGGRYRLFGSKAKFKPATTGQAPCWYGLAEAVILAKTTGQRSIVLVNGQPSVIACHAHGIPAFTIPGGEGNLVTYMKAGLLPELKALWSEPITVALDGDKQGYKAAPEVVDLLKLEGFSAVAKDLGKDNDAADFCVQNNSNSAQAIHNLPNLTSATTTSPSVAGNSHRTIEVYDRAMHEIAPEVWDAVVAANKPPTLFRNSGSLLHLGTDDSGQAIILPVDKHRLRAILSKSCIFQETRARQSGGQSIIQRAAPDDVVQHLLHTIDDRLPLLTRIVHCPTFALDGILLDTAGYHTSGKVYYDPRPGLIIPPIPDQPSAANLAVARSLIDDDLLRDFPFVEAADRAHAIALFLLPFIREMIPGPTPLHLIEAPAMGSGKTLLAEILPLASLGSHPTPMPEATTDDEWRKRLLATLLNGSTTLYIDNLSQKLDSSALALALTARELEDRKLGQSEMLRVPVRCVWLATANNPSFSTEIARRCIRIRIDPKVDKPWERGGFRHQDLRAWTKQHQGELIWAACVMIRWGLAHGSPGRRIGSFEDWSELLGKILLGCGISGFLDNLNAFYERADAEGAAWRSLIGFWWDQYQVQQVQASVLYLIVELQDIDLGLRGATDKALKGSFGKALAKMKDRVLNITDGQGNERQLQIVQSGIVHNTATWRLVELTKANNP